MQNPEIIIVPAFFATIAYVAWVWLSTSQRKQRVKLLTEFHTRLLDKLGSVKDFGEFMQTDAGAKLMADLASEPVSAGPHDRIMRAAQIGVVLTCLGAGLLLVSLVSATTGGQEGFIAIGAISLSLGVGFALSAAASYRLAGMLGLLARTPGSTVEPATSRA